MITEDLSPFGKPIALPRDRRAASSSCTALRRTHRCRIRPPPAAHAHLRIPGQRCLPDLLWRDDESCRGEVSPHPGPARARFAQFGGPRPLKIRTWAICIAVRVAGERQGKANSAAIEHERTTEEPGGVGRAAHPAAWARRSRGCSRRKGRALRWLTCSARRASRSPPTSRRRRRGDLCRL